MLGRIVGTAVLVGAGIAAVAVVVAGPRLLRVARPTLREGLKRGMELYAQARGAAAEFAEDVEDLVAEVQAEIGRSTGGSVRAEEDEKA